MKRKEQHQAMSDFARRVIQSMWDGGDVYGGDVQDWAAELGLIIVKTATKADEEQFGGDIVAGELMYEFSKWMRAPPVPSPHPEGGSSVKKD